jgi:hypothetical protein
MSEAIPVLPYREREYGRGPLLVVLAILAILFGVFSIGESILYMVEMRLRFSSLPIPMMINTMSSYVVSAIHMLALVACAIAFLAHKKHVGALLTAYFCVSLFQFALDPVLRGWVDLTRPGSNALVLITLSIVVAIPHVVVDLVILMLLQTVEVRRIIDDVTAVQN